MDKLLKLHGVLSLMILLHHGRPLRLNMVIRLLSLLLLWLFKLLLLWLFKMLLPLLFKLLLLLMSI
jgi:hypothetical protein